MSWESRKNKRQRRHAQRALRRMRHEQLSIALLLLKDYKVSQGIDWADAAVDSRYLAEAVGVVKTYDKILARFPKVEFK
jgi:hypothetical protein